MSRDQNIQSEEDLVVSVFSLCSHACTSVNFYKFNSLACMSLLSVHSR